MRVASKLVGLTLMALAPAAFAQGPGAPEVAPAAPIPPPPVPAEVPAPPPPVVESTMPAAPADHESRIDVGLSFLPMEAGKVNTPLSSSEVVTGDASFAYGLSLNANFRIIKGLSLGLAPQIVWNVKTKVNATQLLSAGADKEYDLMLRVAYTHRLPGGISVYGEVLPGYSLLMPPAGKVPKGLVLAVGAGLAMDITPRYFLNIGGGYQWGFQSLVVSGENNDYHVRYIRITLGGGVRF